MRQSPAQEFFEEAAKVAPYALLAHEASHGAPPGRNAPGWVVFAVRDGDAFGEEVLRFLARCGAINLQRARADAIPNVLAVTVCVDAPTALVLLMGMHVPMREAVDACFCTPPGRFTLIAISNGKAVCKDVDRLPKSGAPSAAAPLQTTEPPCSACHGTRAHAACNGTGRAFEQAMRADRYDADLAKHLACNIDGCIGCTCLGCQGGACPMCCHERNGGVHA